jgi:hypothetical protein
MAPLGNFFCVKQIDPMAIIDGDDDWSLLNKRTDVSVYCNL